MITYTNPIVQNDLNELIERDINWKSLNNKSILVTGATGMLASYVAFTIIFLNEHYNYNITIFLLARNIENLKITYGSETNNIKFLIQDICEDIKLEDNVDYIFHAAGGSSPYEILHNPTGIIKANTLGTLRVLELAKRVSTEKILFTSTREIYGKTNNIERIRESDSGTIDPLSYRSCYPESKRLAESLLKSYSVQYGVNFNSLRIAHTYGPGMKIESDGRVMADLINYASKSIDIQLNSDGKAMRAFCYISDAIDAIFRILIHGNNNEAFNIANETEPISILKLSHLIQKIAGKNNTVKLPKEHNKAKGYTNYKRIKLDTSKIEALGWVPKITLLKGIKRTLESLK